MDYECAPSARPNSSSTAAEEETERLIPKHRYDRKPPIPKKSTASTIATVGGGILGIPLSVVAANPLIEIKSNKCPTSTILSHRFANEGGTDSGSNGTNYSSCRYSSDTAASKDDSTAARHSGPKENNNGSSSASNEPDKAPLSSYLKRCQHVISLNHRYNSIPTMMEQYHRTRTMTTTTTYRGLLLAVLLAVIAIVLRGHITSSSPVSYMQGEIVEPVWGSAIEAKVWNLIWGRRDTDTANTSNDTYTKLVWGRHGHKHRPTATNTTGSTPPPNSNIPIDTATEELVIRLRPIAKLRSTNPHLLYQKKHPSPKRNWSSPGNSSLTPDRATLPSWVWRAVRGV